MTPTEQQVARLRIALSEVARLPHRAHRLADYCPACIALFALDVDDREDAP